MTPDLTQFDGMQPSQVIRALRAEGYDVIGAGFDSTVLARPDGDVVIRITNFAAQAEAFARLCRAHENNPHLPRIFDFRRIEGDPPLAITVMERLQTLDQIPQDRRRVFGGFARALATLVDGHESHDDAHAEMLKKHEVAQAARAIADTLVNQFEKAGREFLYYDSGYSEEQNGSIEDWYPDNVMFRPRGDDIWDIVFTDPFREGMLGRDPEQRGQLRAEFNALKSRIETLSAARKKTAQQPAPCSP